MISEKWDIQVGIQAYKYLCFLKETSSSKALDYVEQRRQPIPYIKRLSSRKLAKYIGHSLNHIEDADDKSYMQVLFENMPILKRVRRLVKKFKAMLKTGEGQVQEWIKSIEDSKDKLPGLKTFARGLKRDMKAVQNGIQLKWSNGLVEGHVNRIKVLNDRCTGGQALNCFAGKSCYPSQDDSLKLTKNLFLIRHIEFMVQGLMVWGARFGSRFNLKSDNKFQFF